MRAAVLRAVRTAICMFIGLCTGRMAADIYTRQPGINAIHYVFRLRLSDDFDESYRDGKASTEDFRKAMEEACGAGLRSFFSHWRNRAGLPVVEGGWVYEAAAKKIPIELSQTQAGRSLSLTFGSERPGDGRGATADRKDRDDAQHGSVRDGSGEGAHGGGG